MVKKFQVVKLSSYALVPLASSTTENDIMQIIYSGTPKMRREVALPRVV